MFVYPHAYLHKDSDLVAGLEIRLEIWLDILS